MKKHSIFRSGSSRHFQSSIWIHWCALKKSYDKTMESKCFFALRTLSRYCRQLQKTVSPAAHINDFEFYCWRPSGVLYDGVLERCDSYTMWFTDLVICFTYYTSFYALFFLLKIHYGVPYSLYTCKMLYREYKVQEEYSEHGPVYVPAGDCQLLSIV